MENIENLPVPKDLGKQNKRHHNISVTRDRPPGKFLKNGRLLRNEKKGGGGSYNYGVAGDETKVYVNEVEGILNTDLINHDAKILDQFHGTSTVSIVPPKKEEVEYDEDEWEGAEDELDEDEYYDEEEGDEGGEEED